ncbi:ester cyclase [Plantactinospora sp. GCM10030261]|uniref:ester cyclase n=1 Tax=Plantactinospora sp. GCM10030261 TaxID=3273420 RepID=UPI00360F2077
MTSEKNVDLLRHAFRLLDSGDLDACGDLLTTDFIANIPGLPGPRTGRESWKAGVRAMRDGFPDLRVDVEDIFGVGDKVVVRSRLHGTHGGAFQGIPPTHRKVSITSIEIYRVVGDRIAEEWVSPDMMSLFRQISPPGEA